jgi:bifunctional UDP-N-acetylglucosamine pyrophosphorylase/glucosamine-1-phosphate N-acetyltransferase
LQLRHNQKIMLSGVTMFAPETILLEPAGSIGRDSMLQPGVRVTGSSTLGSEVVLETGAILHNCTLGNQAVIGAYSILQDCTIAPGEHLPPLSVRRG